MKAPTEVRLYTKAEREAALAAWREAERERKYSHESAQDDARATRSLPTRRARVSAFKRTGKVPAGWMTPDTIKFGGIMTDKEAARVVLPPGLKPRTAFAPSLRDEVTERVTRRYLTAKGERLLETREERPWPAAQYTRQWEVWTCGCHVEGTGKVTGTQHGPAEFHVGKTEEYEREHVKPCERHKAAFQGREGE